MKGIPELRLVSRLAWFKLVFATIRAIPLMTIFPILLLFGFDDFSPSFEE